MAEDSRTKEVGKEIGGEVKPVSDRVWYYVEDEVWKELPFLYNDKTVDKIRNGVGTQIMQQVKNPIVRHLREICETS